MSAVTIGMRHAYYAPTRKRWYFTAGAAARQEAGAMIRRKYPTESEPDVGHYWHWAQDDRLCEAHARLTRLLLRRMKA